MTELLDIPHDSEKLREILSEKRYLLSQDIIDEYLRLEKDDAYFGMSQQPGQTGSLVLDLKNMQDIAQSQFSKLKSEYQKETGYEL